MVKYMSLENACYRAGNRGLRPLNLCTKSPEQASAMMPREPELLRGGLAASAFSLQVCVTREAVANRIV
jgi:hypothetical protein